MITETLVQRLKSNELTLGEINEVAAYYILLAKRTVSRFRNPDEFLGAALLGITYAITQVQKLIDNNLTAWVMACVKNFIRQCYNSQHLICVPQSTIRINRKKGEDMSLPVVVSIDNTDKECYSMKRYQEIVDTIDDACLDDIDREIVRFRIEGYRDTEIGLRISKSQAFVQRRRAELESRFYASLDR